MVFVPRRRRLKRCILATSIVCVVIYLLLTFSRLWSVDLYAENTEIKKENEGGKIVTELLRKPRNRHDSEINHSINPSSQAKLSQHSKRTLNGTWIHHPWTSSLIGHLNVHVWLDWCGSTVNDLRRNIYFPKFPDVRVKTKLFHLAHDSHNYGQRVFGFLHPPRTGYYIFAISSDDSSELWLSPDESPTSARLIAWVGNLTDNVWGATTSDRQFTKYKSQISGKIFLTQGGRYFVEALHKQSSSNDHLLVGWKIPRLKNFSYITSGRMSQYIHPHIQHKLDVVQYSRHIPLTPATLKLAVVPESFRTEHHTPSKKCRTSDTKVPTKSVAADIYPTCSATYSPSYLVKFNLTRYQGVYLVHETAVYPYDNTALPYMEQYRPCDEKRGVDSHGQQLPASLYGVNEEITPTEDNEWVTEHLKNTASVLEKENNSVTTDDQFIGRKILAVSLPVVGNKQKEFPRFRNQTLHKMTQATPSGPSHVETQKDSVAYGLQRKDKKGNGDNGGVEDKGVVEDRGGIEGRHGIQGNGVKNKGGIDGIGGKGGVENKGGIGDRGSIGGRHGSEGKSSIAIEAHQGSLLKHNQKTHRQQGRHLQPNLNLKAGKKPKEQRNNSVTSNMSQVGRNITPLPLTRVSAGLKDKHTGGNRDFEARRSGKYIVSSSRRKKKDLQKDLPKDKALDSGNSRRDTNTGDKTGDEGSKRTGGTSLNSRNSNDTVRLKRTNGSRKTGHHQQDNGDKRVHNEQVNYTVNSERRRIWRRTGKAKLNADWSVGIPRIRRLKKSGLWDLMKKYAKEKNLVFTIKTWNYVAWKYLHYHKPRPDKVVEFVYKQNAVQCRIDGNLLLNKDVARGIVLKYFKDLQKGLSRDLQLIEVVNVEENHDVYKGDRYLIELDVQMRGKNETLRLSDYVYLPLGENSFCAPRDFVWQKNTTVHVIVPVKNQGKWVQHFIDDMSELYEETLDPNLSVIIVDFNSIDIDIEKALADSALKRYQLVKVNGSFQRALGVQVGLEAVKDPNDIVFTCDLHLEIPNNMIEIIRKHCVQGKMAFSPMVMRLDCGFTPSLPYGEWETLGFGLFAIYKSDFDRIGGMNHEEFKTKWGGEDWEMVDRFLQSQMEIARFRVPMFYHFYHSKSGMWGTYSYDDIVSESGQNTVAEDQFVPAYRPEDDYFSQYNYNQRLLPGL